MSQSYVEYNYIDLQESISSIDFSPSPLNDYFAIGLIDESVMVWKSNSIENIQGMKEENRWEGHNMGVVDIKFNEDGNRLAVSSLDSYIRVWNLDEGTKISEIKCNPMANWKLTFLCDGHNVVTSGELGKTQCFNIDTAENLGVYDSVEIFSTSICASKDDKFVATGNNLGGVFLYDIKNNWKSFRIDCHHKIIRSLQFTKDCSKIITASDDQQIKVVDLSTLQPIFTFSGHKGNINCVDCSPVDDKLFITCSYDKTIKLWDLTSKSCIDTINYHNDNIWAAKFNFNAKIIGSGISLAAYQLNILGGMKVPIQNNANLKGFISLINNS